MKLTYSTVVRGYALLTVSSAVVALSLVIVGLIWQSFEVGFVGAFILALSSLCAVRWMELAEREAALSLEQGEKA